MMPGMDTCYIYSVGTNEIIMADQIKIFPNPARDKFEVRSAEFGIDKIELFDIMGRKVLEQEYPTNTTDAEVDISHLESGSYYCRISTLNKSITKKILIR